MSPRLIGISAVFAFPRSTIYIAADDDTRVKSPYGCKSGEQLPLLIVDFQVGASKSHCGCVSVMIENHKARGVVIAARGDDPAALQLAKSIDSLLPTERGSKK